MRAVVLAGGYGKRMWPLTRDLPKPLLQIGGRPAIDYIVDRLLEIDVAKIFVSTNLKFENQFRNWLAKKATDKIEIVVERSMSENEKLGATRALAELAHQLPADDYVVVAGDNILTASLESMVTFYYHARKSVVAVFDADDYAEVRRGSTVSLGEDMRIVGFEEKPTHPTGRMIGASLYILPFPSLQKTEEYLREGGKSDEPGHFISWLCKKETVYGFKLPGRVWDIGSMAEYERTQREIAQRQSGDGSW